MNDEETRERLRTLDGRTIVVEAGAGTGKTHTLVERIVELVATGRLTMDALAAITFTDAAAAELRDRVRSRLERAAREETIEGRRSRCAAEAGRVDVAAIQTIHSFAADLLRAYPIEAGLPPGFAVWDAIRERQEFEDRFRTWLFDDVPDETNRERRTAFRRAFALGMKPDDLRALARAVHEHYDLLAATSAWRSDAPPDIVDACRVCGAELWALQDRLDLALDPEADRLACEVRRVMRFAGPMMSAQTVDDALRAIQDLKANRPKQVGAAKGWRGRDGETAVREIKAAFKAIGGTDSYESNVDLLLKAYRTDTLNSVLSALRDFVLAGADRRRRQGVATFHDLLTWARDLLREHSAVRRQAQRRFGQIFVDEFQDTDPLQAEIVCLLAGDSETESVDWRSLPLRPGVLFLVGDPKQSIYRFRRADIQIYDAVYARAELAQPREYLVRSFRSTVPVLAYVNELFQTLLSEERYPVPGVQAKPNDLEPAPQRLEVPGAGVKRLGDRGPWKAPEKWRLEAADVAQIAAQIVADGWQVAVRGPEGDSLRPAGYGDICILMPSRTNLRLIERSLEERGVPYRVASGTLVLDTQEVRDLLACLRAIDDPSDQIALIGALRSPAYACSDAALYAWVRDSGELDYLGREALNAGHGAVRDAFASLRCLHGQRQTVSAALLVERLVRERWLTVQAYGQPRPREVWRRLRYVVERARSFAAGGRGGLRELLDWLDERRSETFYDAESPAPDADERAVQIMTIHGAKGLEFPIVLLAGTGSRGNGRSGPAVACGRGLNPIEASCGDFKTSGWDGDLEKALDDAEQVRLLYVATTRARDHLVISMYHTEDDCRGGQCHVERLEEAVRAGVADAAPLTPHELPDPVLTPLPEDPPQEDLEDEDAWQLRRSALIDRLSALRLRAPSHLRASGPAPDFVVEPPAEPFPSPESEPIDLEDAAAAEPMARGRGGTQLGQAVHLALQRLDLAAMTHLDAVAASAARETGIPDQAQAVRVLVEALAASPTARAAAQSGRYWREVPVGAVVDGVTLSGAIDLIWEQADGTLSVVDYKTDQIPAEETEVRKRARYYSLQLGAYVLALRTMGLPVSRAELLFATTAGAWPAPYEGEALDTIVSAARAALTAVAGAEPAPVPAG